VGQERSKGRVVVRIGLRWGRAYEVVDAVPVVWRVELIRVIDGKGYVIVEAFGGTEQSDRGVIG
jgi:hypothetical protein